MEPERENQSILNYDQSLQAQKKCLLFPENSVLAFNKTSIVCAITGVRYFESDFINYVAQ